MALKTSDRGVAETETRCPGINRIVFLRFCTEKGC